MLPKCVLKYSLPRGTSFPQTSKIYKTLYKRVSDWAKCILEKTVGIKKKRLTAKSMGAPTRLAKPTRPRHLSSCLFPQTIFFLPLWFPSEIAPPSGDVSFVHTGGWSRNWDLGWSQATVQPSPDFPSSIFHPHCQLFDIWRLGQRNELLFNIYFILFLSIRPKKKILSMREEEIVTKK